MEVPNDSLDAEISESQQNALRCEELVVILCEDEPQNTAYELAASELYGHVKPVVARAIGKYQSSIDTEEVSQAASTTIFEWVTSGRYTPGNFFGWCSTIAKHKAIDACRRDNRVSKKTVSIDYESDSGQQIELESDDDVAGDVVKLSVEEMVAKMYETDINTNFIDALALHVLYDMHYEQIAEKLNISSGTVRSRIFRAKTSLRKVLNSGADSELQAIIDDEATAYYRERAQNRQLATKSLLT